MRQTLDQVQQFCLQDLKEQLGSPLLLPSRHHLSKFHGKHPNPRHLSRSYHLYHQCLIFLQYQARPELTFFVKLLLSHVY